MSEIKEKTGWFARLKQGLRKTQVNLVGIFTGGVVDEAFLEDLEFQMISADIGVETSALILERLRERIKLKGLKTQDEVKVALKEIIADILRPCEASLNFDEQKPQLYTKEMLQQVLLGLYSMCKGADAKFFNGHSNLTSTRFLVFGVKGLNEVAANVRSTILLNLLSYMTDKLLIEGNTVAALDELYIWLSNPTAIEYIRNCLKRVRKKESAVLLASQNLEDFDQEQVREMTKPLFSIPPHQFLFNAGSIDKRSYMEMLQLDEAEYNLIKFPQRGVCLYKCGNERYLLEVHAPAYKEKLFGTAGGR